MMRLSVVGSLLALLGFILPTQAFAYEKNYGAHGYEMPGKYRRGAKEAKADKPTKKEDQGFFFFGKSKSDDDDDDDDDDKSKKLTKGAAELKGGGRPSIAPVAPPKVAFTNSYGAGSIVIDTSRRTLYYVLSSSEAYKYPISVGRQGFTWTGTESISRKVAWPDWRPPQEMLQRRPELPVVMTGGIRNPLGAMALYLGNSLYRIHGTNDVKSIGQAASSGCFRMMNGHVVHLASLAGIGTKVHVLSKLPANVAKAY